MFEHEVFRKQMYCIDESICDNVGTLRCPPQSFGARGIVLPGLPSLRPGEEEFFLMPFVNRTYCCLIAAKLACDLAWLPWELFDVTQWTVHRRTVHCVY